jgi:cholesterol oxidase
MADFAVGLRVWVNGLVVGATDTRGGGRVYHSSDDVRQAVALLLRRAELMETSKDNNNDQNGWFLRLRLPEDEAQREHKKQLPFSPRCEERPLDDHHWRSALQEIQVNRGRREAKTVPIVDLSLVFPQQTTANSGSVLAEFLRNGGKPPLDPDGGCERAERHRSHASRLHPQLSNEVEDLVSRKDGLHFDYLVVGSGYGAGVAAMRLSEVMAGDRKERRRQPQRPGSASSGKPAPTSIGIFERGEEWRVGSFPDTEDDFRPNARITLMDGSVYGPRAGFFDWTISTNTIVWKGNALGGGSTVNSNVAIEPDPRVYALPGWPKSFVQDPELLTRGFERARSVLTPSPYPREATAPLAKFEALKAAGAGADESPGGSVKLWDLNVTWENRTNAQGVFQPACIGCGSCNTGCNTGAKNMVFLNYLQAARNNGAEVYTCMEVLSYEPRGGPDAKDGWTVHAQLLPAYGTRGELFAPVPMTLTCNNLILGAGSLGSTEITLRAKKLHQVTLSPMAGQHFGLDGDAFGVAYNVDREADTTAWNPHEQPPDMPPIGPCILGVWDLRKDRPCDEGMIIEDMAWPAMFTELMSSLMPLGHATIGVETATTEAERVAQYVREAITVGQGPYAPGSSARFTLFMGLMAHDDQLGVMSLDAATDGLAINWPTAVNPTRRARRNHAFEAATRALEGIYIRDPMAGPVEVDGEGVPPIKAGVHPLGGLCMGDTAAEGAVNDRGQVYSSSTGTDVYENLYCMDGAIIPTSVGVNTLLSITAVAERCMDIMATANGWQELLPANAEPDASEGVTW